MFCLSSNINVYTMNCIISIDLSCALAGFINSIQTTCLQCKSGYYLVDKECLASCPAGYVPHEDTKSCQSNFIIL